MATISRQLARTATIVAIMGIVVASAFVADESGAGLVNGNAEAEITSRVYSNGYISRPNPESGSLPDAGIGSALMQQTEDARGMILVDNYGNTSSAATSETFDDAQGFTTGTARYLLTGVELATINATPGAKVAVFISEPAGAGHPGTTSYVLDAPSNLVGRPFFKAPENALLAPNTSYLVRIDVTAGSVGWEFTTNKTETTLGLSGWSLEDHFWVSSGDTQGIDWGMDTSKVFALTIWGKEPADDFGEDSFTSGYLAFNRHSNESPMVQGTIGNGTDKDWFNSSLSFDYGGRYRIDVDATELTDADDVSVRAFYLDNPHYSSGVVDVEVESVTDPPEGYVSWHFIAGRNYGPYIEVSADNGSTGDYGIRIVYDPDRIWTGTEVVRGDLYHDDTTWATITVDSVEADQGVYHYYEDYDWFAVELEDDTNYTFLATAAGPYSHYMHPAIKLYDDAGTELASEYISHSDESATSVTTRIDVGAGERGTYYVEVTNAQLWDDPVKMANVGITEPLVLHSPFLATRYYLAAGTVADNMRSLRSVPVNAEPRILNRRAISLEEGTRLAEYITAYDSDAQDTATGFEIIGGDDGDLFSISSSGVLSMRLVPDFEVPADRNMDNAYEVQVRVTSGSEGRERLSTADLTVTVTDDDAEAERVLVSNTGKRNDGNATVKNSDHAIRIHTGRNSEGYVIHGLALKFQEALADPNGVRVSLWSSHVPGRYSRPNAQIFAFINPTSIEARLTEFTAPPDTVLEPDASYWIVIERTGGTALKFLETRSDSEDSISEADWDIGSLKFHRPRNMNGPWTDWKVKSERDQLKVRVIGYERGNE